MSFDVNNLFRYQASTGGLVRIVLWTLLFLALASWRLPAAPESAPFTKNTAGTRIRPVSTIGEDPRYQRDDVARRDGINISWVTDSTSAIFPPDKMIPDASYDEVKLLASTTLDKLHKRLGMKNTYLDLDIQLGLRSIESYSSVVAAIDRKPDAIVISFNPFWMFTSYEIQKRQEHLNRASGLWAEHIESWPWLPLITSPANHLWAAAAEPFRILRDASLYRGELEQVLPSYAEKASSGSGKVEILKSSVVFWFCYEGLKAQCGEVLNENGQGVNTHKWYSHLLRLADLSGDSLTWWAWQNTLEILRQSGIPTLIYVIPVSDSMRQDIKTYDNLLKIQSVLRGFRQHYEGSNIHIIDHVPDSVVKTMVFRSDDLAHMVSPGQFDDYLADQIWHILQKPRPEKNGSKKHG